jgi:putative membrane protein
MSIIMAALVAAPVLGHAADKAATMATPEDSKVLAELNHSNLMEIQMGQLAQSHGQSEAVKNYGKELEQDHKDAQDKTESVAKQVGVKLPSESQAMAGEDHSKMDQLKALKGSQFDHAFAEAMKKDHDKDISKLESAQKSLSGPTADLVSQVLPVLKKHQQAAKQLTMKPGWSSTATQ